MSKRTERAERDYRKLIEYLSGLDGVAVAFSGGVDSTLLAKAAFDALGERAIAVTARSSTYPEEEFDASVEIAGEIGIEQVTIDTKEMEDPRFLANPPDRCYYCKNELIHAVREIARERGLAEIAEGTTSDDDTDYRPGSRASAELGALKPLKELGFGKSDVREMLDMLGLPNWQKPATACLASRLPYHSEITPDKLRAIEEAEKFIRGFGISNLRVRHHGSVARIEVDKADFKRMLDEKLREQIYNGLRDLGFQFVALDLIGYRTGSLNEELEDL